MSQIVEDLMVEALISEPIGITSVEAAGPHRQNRERNRELSDEFDIGDDVEIRRSKTQSYVKYVYLNYHFYCTPYFFNHFLYF